MKNTLTKARVAAASVMAAVAIGAGLMAAPTASAITADDLTYTEFAYAYTYGSGAICPVFENHPTANGLLGIAKSIMSDGFVQSGCDPACTKYRQLTPAWSSRYVRSVQA